MLALKIVELNNKKEIEKQKCNAKQDQYLAKKESDIVKAEQKSLTKQQKIQTTTAKKVANETEKFNKTIAKMGEQNSKLTSCQQPPVTYPEC